MVCPDCGYVFPPPQTVKKTASTDEVMKGLNAAVPQIEDFYVISVRYSIHLSKAGNKTMKVLYSIGTHNFNEYFNFRDGNAYDSRKLRLWWEHRGGETPLPTTAEEAIARAREELRVPTTIRVIVNQKYPEIIGSDFKAESHLELESDGEDESSIPF
jgi:hypothetical protein